MYEIDIGPKRAITGGYLKMKKLSAIMITVLLLGTASLMAGCENKAKQEQHAETKSTLETTQQELEQLKQDSTKLDAYISDMKSEIKSLRIENQKMIAANKRLEAEIIDLKLELGQIPKTDSSDALSTDTNSDTQDQDSGTADDTSDTDSNADDSDAPDGEQEV